MLKLDGLNSLLLAVAGDGAGEWMGGQFFERISQPRDFLFASGRKAFDLFHAQFTGGERAGLVEATVLTSASFSTAAPPRKRIPCRAPHAMAASTADGIESTSAHGEETTSRVMVR